MKTEVYDHVRVETLEEGDRFEIAGYTCVLRGVEDFGSHLELTWYNEDTDEDEDDVFFPGTIVGLVHNTYND